MSAYPEEAAMSLHPFDHPAREPGDTVVLFSNRFFDPMEATRLYAERKEEYLEAERVGFDGIMTNEHHAGPFCMQSRCNITSAMLAGITERVKIVQLGNPIPLWDNPVQLAEETAMIDCMSGGRLVAGIVRGGGNEQFSNNVNPAFNRERFEEGHDLLIKAWTQPGPFRWEGNHYQVPIVNPWAVPVQKPHPRVWVPGVTSFETVIWAAQHRYPYICLTTTLEETERIWKVYGDAAEEAGYTAGEDLPRLPRSVPCPGGRGEGPEKRHGVHVDAGRVHRDEQAMAECTCGLQQPTIEVGPLEARQQPPRCGPGRRSSAADSSKGDCSLGHRNK